MSHAYDQGPSQGDVGAYSNYDVAPPQVSAYQNPPPQFGGLSASDSYSSGYGNYEGALNIKTE
jgi:hypothetical protein